MVVLESSHTLCKSHSKDRGQKVPGGGAADPPSQGTTHPEKKDPHLQDLTVMKTEVSYHGGVQLVPTPNLTLSGYKGKSS